MRKKPLLFLCVLFSITGIYSQSITITGKVTDDKGTPISGANISTKKSKKVLTLTNTEGSFLASVPSGEMILVSYVGYLTQELNPADGMSVSLKPDVGTLSEVVVTGVGVATSKRKLGISVESIASDKLPQTPTASIDQALIGKIPGAQISSVSGNPGDPVNIVLRGINSFSGTSPLIIVDGVQVSGVDLNSLDLSNIERVEVVQGAASATIYGAQGANGAIQIFTKKGKKGATRIDFSSSYSNNKFLNVGDVQKSKLHPYLTDASGNILDNATGEPVVLNEDGTLPRISYRYGAPALGAGASARLAILGPQNINDQPYNANLKFYDHFDQMFQSAFTVNNNLSLSGGGDKSDFNLAASNNVTESPILRNGKLNRSNLSINLGTELLKGLKLRSNTQIIYTKNNTVPQLGAPGGSYSGRGNSLNLYSTNGVFGFLNTSPFFDLNYKQPDGTPPNYFNANFLSVNTTNPNYAKYYSSGLDNKIEIIQSFDANYQPARWVELDGKYGINYRNENSRWTYDNQSENVSTTNYDTYISYFGPDETGEIDNWQYTNTYQNLLLSATFKTDFENDFHLHVPIRTSTLVAYDYRKNYYKEYDTYGTGLPLTPPINIGSTGSRNVDLDYVEPFTTYGYLLDQKIELGDWAGVTGGFRTDWSSNFGENLSFTFPHVNGYVNLSSFDFWKNASLSKALSYVKLRSAYGEAGIQPGFGDRYPGIDQTNLGSVLAYTLQTSAKNPLIEVEKTKEFEVGLDFSVKPFTGSWLSSINGSLSYWHRSSKSVISSISLPPSTGAISLNNNIGDLHSRGIQAQLNLPVYSSKTFLWDFTVNFGTSKSIVDKIDGEVQQFTAAAGSVQLKLVAGQPIGQIYGYKALTSVDQLREDGKTPFIAEEDRGKYEIVKGRVVDTASKGIFFSDEASFIGDPNPKFTMSFINGFTYKNFLTLGFQFDWISGSHLYNQTKEWMYRDGIHGDFDEKVTINGVTAAYTAYHGSAYYGLGTALQGPGNNATKDYFYEGASFLRLRNVSLGFDIAKAFNLKFANKLQLVLTGRNIWTVTNYSGFDPEINSGPANSSFERGIDHSTLPNTRSYQVGLNLGL